MLIQHSLDCNPSYFHILTKTARTLHMNAICVNVPILSLSHHVQAWKRWAALDLTSDTLSKIVENWPNLEEFCHNECDRFDDEVVTMFSELKSLKHLKCIDILCSNGIDLLSLINGLWKESVPIELLGLSLTRFDNDKVINGLTKLKHHRTLKMNCLEVTNEDLINLAKSLPLLKVLQVSLSENDSSIDSRCK